MFLKKKIQWTSLILILIILLFVLYLVTYNGPSPIVSLFQWISNNVEGFEVVQSNAPHCPTNYRFFNDTQGESMCCKGKVDPYTHTCLSNAEMDLCAFIPGIKDHRKINGGPLPVCKDITQKIAEQMEKDHCPKSLPNHAASGKCCKNPSDSLSGDCMSHDLADPNASCLIALPKNIIYKTEGNSQKMYNKTTKKYIETTKLCDMVKLFDNSKCPKDSFSVQSGPDGYPHCQATYNTWTESELKRIKELGLGNPLDLRCSTENALKYYKKNIEKWNTKLYDPPISKEIIALYSQGLDSAIFSMRNCTNMKKVIIDGDNTLYEKLMKKQIELDAEYRKSRK